MDEIHFFTEDITFVLEDRSKIQTWLLHIAKDEHFQIDTINYILCSDDYLIGINQEFLNHDYYTDIITFDHSTTEGILLSDIFISIDRVRDNAHESQIPFTNELHRVLVHGLLHLTGYNDKTESEQIVMRQKEDACISLLN